jgi:O-acetyl-ADP-ribose deacetylase
MIVNGTRIALVRGNIVHQHVDVIVNAANSSLLGGGGVDGAIHRAGGPQILEECRAIRAKQGKCNPGEAVITSAGSLPAKYVVHTVGPVWNGGNNAEPETLASAYTRSLELATAHNARTVAFPSISTGAYRYPLDSAAEVALHTVARYCKEKNSFDEIRFVLFDDAAMTAYRAALKVLPQP